MSDVPSSGVVQSFPLRGYREILHDVPALRLDTRKSLKFALQNCSASTTTLDKRMDVLLYYLSIFAQNYHPIVVGSKIDLRSVAIPRAPKIRAGEVSGVLRTRH